MNYALHLAAYGTTYCKFAYGRLYNWIEKEIVASEDEVDLLFHYGPGTEVDVMHHILSEAVKHCGKSPLQIHCFDGDVPAVHKAAQRLQDSGVVFNILSDTIIGEKLTAECMLMMQMAMHAYESFDADKEE